MYYIQPCAQVTGLWPLIGEEWSRDLDTSLSLALRSWLGECKCLLSVSDDIVYLFTYQECLIYLFSQHQVHHNPAAELHRGEHISCISAKNRKTQDQFPVAGRKDENKKMSHLFATIPSFLLVIDISNQNFSIWHLKNIIGLMSRLKYNRLRGESPAI